MSFVMGLSIFVAILLHDRGNVATEVQKTNTTDDVLWALANTAAGFAVGVPGIPGLWDNVIVGVASGAFSTRSCTERIVNGTQALVRRLHRSREAAA